MKGYLRACPHHGFSRDAILVSFYEGALSRYKVALDTASYGSFIQSGIEEGEQLIENLAQSDRCHNGEYDRTIREHGSTNRRAQENDDRTDKVTLLKPRQVQFLDDQAERRRYYLEDRYEDEEVSYVNNQRYQPGQTHPNLSYRNQNVENAQDQVYPAQQRQEGYGYQNQQVYQNRPTYQQGQPNTQPRGYIPPGNPQRNQNTNNYSGLQPSSGNQGRQWNSSRMGENEYQRGAGAIGQPTRDDDEIKGMLRQMIQTMDRSMASLREINGEYDKLATRVTVIEQQNRQIDEHAAKNRRAAEAARTPQESCKTVKPNPQEEPMEEESDEDRPLTPAEAEAASVMTQRLFGGPKVEYPSTPQKEPAQKELSVNKATKGRSPDEMPFELKEASTEEVEAAETLEDIYAGLERASTILETKVRPINQKEWEVYNLLLDEIKTRKDDVRREMRAITGFSRITPSATPEKLEDPGAFTLPCEIGNTLFPKCLTDLGACTSIMPYSTSKRLKLYDLRPSYTSLVMADGTKTNPIGLLLDVKVRVGGAVIPTDFMVVEMEDEPEDPIILGRPFLATAGAKIDLRQDKIELHIGDQLIEYNRKKPPGTLIREWKSRIRGPQRDATNKTRPNPTIYKGGLDNIPTEDLLKTLDVHMGNSELYKAYERVMEQTKRRKLVRPPIKDWPPNTGNFGTEKWALRNPPWNNNIRVVSYVQETRRDAPSNIGRKDPGDKNPKRRRSENWPV